MDAYDVFSDAANTNALKVVLSATWPAILQHAALETTGRGMLL